MPRPQSDIDAVREEMFQAAESLLRTRGAVNINISDVASACNMSQSNFYRYFESKEAFYEAMAGRWFDELDRIMVEVVASDMPAREKLFQFFARRLVVKRARYAAEPELFMSYMEIGDEHWEVIRGYVDLADHHMAQVLGQAMAEGYFEGLELDHVVSVVNLMVQPFVNPSTMVQMERTATEANLRLVIDSILTGLSIGKGGEEDRPRPSGLRIAS